MLPPHGVWVTEAIHARATRANLGLAEVYQLPLDGSIAQCSRNAF